MGKAGLGPNGSSAPHPPLPRQQHCSKPRSGGYKEEEAYLLPGYDKIKQEMFEDRGQSIFPHFLSAWWIPILLVIGWGPLFVADFIYRRNPGEGLGFEEGWGMAIALPFLLLAGLSVLIQALRLITFFINRPKPVSK
jgi:hypothetical protein